MLRSDPGHEGEWVQAPTRGDYSLLVNSGEKLQVCLGLGRTAVSEIGAPNMLGNT